MKNIQPIDRFFRAFLGVILLQLAVFWLEGFWRIACYALGAALLLTAASGISPLYRTLGVGQAAPVALRRTRLFKAGIAWLVLIVEVVGGSYACSVLTHRLFIKDFNEVNEEYNLTLSLTRQNEREQAITRYTNLLPAYQRFQRKYTTLYRPYALRNDAKLSADLAHVGSLLTDARQLVIHGEMQEASRRLEKVRPVFQQILARNGLSGFA